METKRNKRMAVVATIFTLLVVIGASYAYFTGGIKKEGDTTTTVETASLVSATAKFGGTIEANGALPGYKVVKTINIKGGGSSKSKPISAYLILTPDVVDFSNHVKYYIYEVEGDNTVDINSICEESKNTSQNNQYYDDMKCDTSSLGESILEGTFYNTTRVSKEITIEYNTNKTYYILVEYVNDTENPQDEEQGKRFTINLDADTELSTAVKQLIEIAKNSEELVYDDTEDNNIRYIGADPNNYVLFNNELWRIIGIMNNVSDDNGNISSRVKIIRNESIGKYAWNTIGSNDWSTSSLKTLLNEGEYYNRTGSLSEIGLNDVSKEMISDVLWNLGGSDTIEKNAREFYLAERGKEVYTERPATWIGKIGLMYPSDFGYATSGGATNSREECLNETMYQWNLTWAGYSKNLVDCYNNDWLFRNDIQWTMTSTSNTSVAQMYDIYQTGSITFNNFYELYDVRPVLYLNSNIEIVSGTGSSVDPFTLFNN